MKPLIKNKKRYKLVKRPRGLNLENYETLRREGQIGISTEVFGEKWFVTPHGKALFKDYVVGNNDMQIINELLYDELAKQVGLPVAQYLPASLNTNKNKIVYGLASIDVQKKNEKIIPGTEILRYKLFSQNTFEDYMDTIERFGNRNGYVVNTKEIGNTLFKMMVLDALTFMEDRHTSNVAFIKNDVDKYLTASPVIDNEMCFGGRYLWFYKYYLVNVDWNRFITAHGREMKMFVNETAHQADNKNRYVENVKEIIKLAQKIPGASKFLDSALEKFDINLALNNVKEMGYEITPEYEKFVKELSGLSKSVFKNYIKILNQTKDNISKDNKTL